ncbi:related to hexose transporter protein [Serendipita indica DSM 11827]|uniref:Related to hexose transporter protein n=1 Tax=Serendipita indica (strain DSM 11827) TaxID=1109443 RepID=G4TIR7_SERID|nr:related to hexose transporter protein [Serendipita indica DSM 11827]
MGGDIAGGDPLVTQYVLEDTTPWYKKRNLRYLYFVLVPTCIGVEITSGFDSSMMNGLQGVTYWDNYFGHPQGQTLGLMSSAYSLGCILSLPFIPFVVDRLGRRLSIVCGSCVMLVGVALQASAVNYAMFTIARAVMGFGMPICIVSASALIGELSYPKERTYLGSLFNASWFIGAIVAAGTTYGTFAMPNNWSWRIPSILQAAPSLLQISFMMLLPESPRWLISKGREEEAFQILATYHAEGDRESELVKAEYAQINVTIQMEMENSKRSWKEMIATAGMRKRVTIATALGLFTQCYYLKQILKDVGITDNKTVNQINVANTCWGLLNATTIAFLVYKLKRRTAYLLCTTSLLCIYTGWTISAARYTIAKDKQASHAVLAFIFLYSPAYNIGYNALTYTFLVELFPFAVRARGITLFQLFGRMASFFNQYVNPIGIKNAGWKYYLSYVVWLAFEVIFVYFMFPETSGRTLEELAFIFEGEEVRKRQAKETEQELHQGPIGQPMKVASPNEKLPTYNEQMKAEDKA